MHAHPRLIIIDVTRGLAVSLMLIYHGCYDIHYLNWVHFDFYHHPFWLTFRTLIVSLFVILSGISLHLATAGGLQWPKFFKRLFILTSCALLISWVSWLLFQERFIFFGILHFMALASVVGLVFIHRFWWNLWLGIGFILLGTLFAHPWFNQPYWQWLGLMTHKPQTEDYVPLLPWLGVLLLGLFLGRYGAQQSYFHQNTHLIAEKPLAWLGRHSLGIYMLHQPLLLGSLWTITLVIG
ncbi:MAG: heparan-alpha-glucosaminide N-acetyltransferase [Pseudomonadota bacterium]|nr:heparan-alpha-glucosaminide N-acetyltransferase [Pseudomonadota bacterium]